VNTISLTITNDIVTLSGDLIRQTVDTISTEQFKCFLKQESATIDLAAVNKVDTAGLAWLLSQIELAQANACQLCFKHLPSSLIKLAALSSVDKFLPVHRSS
jgi:phospholipid transport system transporter-binding protein|tara:strand:+ start:797 stop:1102 length:306 start_codon:yes stop_codon:yes gene_type:complete